MENYANQGLKIHYLLSYRNHSDCIGNLPTPIASSSRKSILNLLFLISTLFVPPQPLPACVNDCVTLLLKQWFTSAQPLEKSGCLFFSSYAAIHLVLVCVTHTRRKMHSQCPLWLSRRSLTPICLCSAWSQWLASPDWLDGMAEVCTNKAVCPSLMLI